MNQLNFKALVRLTIDLLTVVESPTAFIAPNFLERCNSTFKSGRCDTYRVSRQKLTDKVTTESLRNKEERGKK